MGFFYKIERKGRISYLLGTVHSLPFNVLPKECRVFIKQAKCFIGESHRDSDVTERTFRIKGEPAWYNTLPDGVRDFLETNKDFLEIVMESPIVLQDLSYFTLSSLCSFGLQFMGMDHTITRIATENSSPYFSLDEGFHSDGLSALADENYPEVQFIISEYESIKEIIATIEKLVKYNDPSYGSIIADYEGMLKKYGEILFNRANSLLSEIDEIKIYAERYVSDPHKFVEDALSSGADDTEDKTCCVERNYFWLPKILQLHQSEDAPALVFVGLSHLVGQEGLLKLLEESGFKIQQMGRNGNFTDYGNYSPDKTLAERLVYQTKAYRLLRSQVLDTDRDYTPLLNHNLSWMRQLKDEIVFEKWKEQYRQKYLNAKKNSYGPGALIIRG